jgi:tryptophan halogenase
MKIVIVGGGTAGWITAAMWVKYTNDYDITVIESTKIGIIGAGEGSTGTLPWLIRDMWPDNSINEIDFLRKTKGTLKLGINLIDWKGDGTQIYSPFHGSPTDTKAIDTAFLGSILKYGRGDLSSIHSWMLRDKLSTFRKDGSRIVQGFQNHSYHFDGVEVGKFFKEWCTKRGVKHIDAEVENTVFDGRDYLQSISLSNGETVESNFWFDCSGFARVLMGKTKNKWISYKEHLPCNTAIPFSTDISSKSVKFETEAHARDNGWTWKIPLQHRNGCGYVFCDGFTTEDNAIHELEKKLRHTIEPIKTIKFDPGRWDRVWYNNIVSVGLAQNFLEPLQATSIHTSIISVANLIFHYLKSEVPYFKDIVEYNNSIAMMIDDYKDFIQMHYLTGRQDTPFWKFITNELKISDKNDYLKNVSKFRAITTRDIQNTHGSAGYPLWSYILDNSGCYERDIIKTELQHFGNYDECLTEMFKLEKHYNIHKPNLVSNEELFKYLKI